MDVFFPGKFIFAQIWIKRDQNGPQIGSFFIFLKKFLLLFLHEGFLQIDSITLGLFSEAYPKHPKQ